VVAGVHPENFDCTSPRGTGLDIFSLVLAEDQLLTASLTSDFFDTYLHLFDSDCLPVAEDDDGGIGFNSLLSIDLGAGTYYIGVSSFGAGAAGDFTLAIDCGEGGGPIGKPEETCEECEVALIACGESLDGVHPDNAACFSPRGNGLDIFSLVLEEDKLLIVSLTGDYDTYLHLFDSDCLQVAEDDDGGDGFNSRLEFFATAGTYFVGVSSYGIGQGGNFTVTIGCSDGCANDCILYDVDCDNPLEREFPRSDCTRGAGQPIDFVRFTAPGDIGATTIELSSDAFDPFLELYDINCTLIANNDNGGGDTAARILRNLLPGDYLIGVSSVNADATGDFALTIECGDLIDPNAVCVDCQVGEIECGGTAIADFPASGCVRPGAGNNQNVDLYEFEVGANESFLTIALDALFDTWLVLLDSDCQIVSQNDDGGVGFNSLILIGVEPGTYYVGVSSYGADAAGEYQLVVDCGDIPETCVDCSFGIVSCGLTETNQFPRSDCRSLRGPAMDIYDLVLGGGEVTIDLTGDYDTYLHLYDDSCTEIDSDDDGGNGLNSQIVIDLAPGVYHVGVSSYGTGAAGTFDLTATCFGGENFCVRCRVDNLAPGQSKTSTFPGTKCTLPPFDERVDVYTFAITEPFRGTVRVNTDAFDPTLALFDALCDEIEFNDNCDRGATNSCIDVDLEAGFYSLVISSRDLAAAGEYTILAALGGTEATRFFRGDADGNGNIALSDAVRVFQYLFNGGAASECRESADANNDSNINLTDGVHVLNYLFLQGDLPSPPGPPGIGAPCGPDPDEPGSPGDIGCEVYESC
jgi:hypothetical protein